jgi:hypothetical protein
LEKYRPLRHILCYDDFDHGTCGWFDLKPNHTQKDFRPLKSVIDKTRWGPCMLSTASYGFAGTHGSMDGIYSLKLTTHPVAARYEEPPPAGSLGVAVKRLSFHRPKGLWQFESWYAYTPEQDRFGIGETAIRAFGFWFDIQDDEHRYQPGFRYVNSVNGELRQQWQMLMPKKVSDREWGFGSDIEWAKRGIDGLWYGRRYPDGEGDAFRFLPNGKQQLCYNETDDKINWLYFRMLIDTAKREYVEMQSGNSIFDLSGTKIEVCAPYMRVRGLVNPLVWIEADTDRRVFLYLDSIVISQD